MTPPNITASSTLTTGTAPLTAPASAGAVVAHEFLWCVLECVFCCGLSLNHPPFGGVKITNLKMAKELGIASKKLSLLRTAVRMPKKERLRKRYRKLGVYRS
jgi:hypothetical protein